MKNNFIFIVFDSCRFDTFQAASTPQIDRRGPTEKRYAYASWTTPSHAVYFMGVTPHKSPKNVFASTVYQEDFKLWSSRLNVPDISFKRFVPELNLANFLKGNGYRTAAYVSMPVLNQHTAFNQYFDAYELMPKHNDFNAVLDKLTFQKDTPSYYFLNLGETHYPYTLPHESAEHLPRIHGVHGVFKNMDELMTKKKGVAVEEPSTELFFSDEQMRELKEKQRTNIEYLDRLFEKLYDLAPPNTHILVTSDHGELFGEEGYFGHGPIFHEKVFEVFFVEGKRK